MFPPEASEVLEQAFIPPPTHTRDSTQYTHRHALNTVHTVYIRHIYNDPHLGF